MCNCSSHCSCSCTTNSSVTDVMLEIFTGGFYNSGTFK